MSSVNSHSLLAFFGKSSRPVPVFVRARGQYLYLSELAASTCICQSSRPVPVFVTSCGQYLYLSHLAASTCICQSSRPVPVFVRVGDIPLFVRVGDIPLFVRVGGQYFYSTQPAASIWPVLLLISLLQFLYCRSRWPVPILVGAGGQYLKVGASGQYLCWPEPVASTFTVRANGQYLYWSEPVASTLKSEPVASASTGQSQWPVPLLVGAGGQYLNWPELLLAVCS